jgi:hypothetical protein
MSGQENKKEDTKLNVTLGEVHSHDPKAHKQINISCAARDKDVLKITFHRTVRVPDNENTYQLPPSLSQFPFYSVQDYNETFPQEMAAKGGIFFPCIVSKTDLEIFSSCFVTVPNEMAV